MSFTETLEKLENRAKELEEMMAQSLANHNVLIGHATEIKNVIRMMTEAAEVIAPNNLCTKSLEAVETVVDEFSSSETTVVTAD